MTSPIRSIVAASDFSFSAYRAARRAGTLAGAHGAALQLLHVIDNSPAKALLRSSTLLDAQRLRLAGESGLASLAHDVRTRGGIVVEQSLREGRVIDQMLAAAASSDLLVLGPRGLNPLRDFIIGSTAERMARMIERPMLVVKQDPHIPYEHVLVPVDFSAYSASALRFAADLAPSATLHALHAFDCPLEASLRRAGVTAEAVAAYREELLREAHAHMDELTAGLHGRPVLGEVRSGDARVLINEQATARRCALIVMGKQGRSWLSEHVLGSVTRVVLERAACDVVVVPSR